MFEAKNLHHLVTLDHQPLRWRIGLVSLSTDLSVEQDFYSMRPTHEMGFFTNRVEFINPTNRENLLAMQPKISEAARLILPDIPLDSIVYACTSASAAIGDENIRRVVNQGKPDTPCITPTSGAIEGLRKLGINKVSLIAPYIKSVSEDLANYFSSLGLDIVSLHYMDIDDDRNIGKVSQQSILDCINHINDVNSEAVFLSCTALPVVPILNQIESLTNRIALSSNQAMFWQAIREAGYHQPIQGFGRLLEI